MTVPIVPGPWSFLGNIGQGVAGYLGGKEQFRQKKLEEDAADRKEAFDKLGFLFKGIQEGSIEAKVVKSPLFLDLIGRSGMGEGFGDSVIPSPQGIVNKERGGLIPGVINSLSPEASADFAATGNIPTVSETATRKRDALVANTQSNTIEKGGAPARAAAGVLDETVATAGEEAAKEPLYNSVAGRSVDATLTRLKITRLDPSNVAAVASNAWALAQRDAKTSGFTLSEEITKPYIDAAIQQRLRQQEELDVKREAARNTGQGVDPMISMLNFYQRQQQRVNDAVKSLNPPGIAEKAMASGIETLLLQGKTIDQIMSDPNVSPLSKKAYIEVQAYDQQLESYRLEANGYRDNIGQILGKQVGAADPSAPPAGTPRTGDGAGGQAQRVAQLTKAAQMFTERRADPKNKDKTDKQIADEIKKELKL